MNPSQDKPNRRRFLSTSSQLVAASTVAAATAPGLAVGYHNSVNDVLKIGLVGCGGRGTAAVLNATGADSNVQVTALADAFRDRIDSCHASLTEQIPEKMVVDDDHKFTGFDCLQEFMCRRCRRRVVGDAALLSPRPVESRDRCQQTRIL